MDGFDWSNITSNGALIITLIFGITKSIPNMIQSFRDEQQELRTDHRKAMNAANERSERMVESGHAVVGQLSATVGRVADEVQALREHTVANPCKASDD
jgi:hypothetical protein